MSGNNFITVPSLVDSSQGVDKEEMFNQAHDILDSLEAPITRIYDLKAFIDGLQSNPETAHLGPAPDVSITVNLTLAHYVHELVDGPLFAGQAFKQPMLFDNLVDKITQRINTDMQQLEEFATRALGQLPEEIPSAPGRASGQMYLELASLLGSSQLPSLKSSFSEKSQAQIKRQAQELVKSLGRQLDTVKAVALEQISRGQGNFYTWGFHDLYEVSEDLALLRGYVNKSQRNNRTISKFMASKLDRVAASLDCHMRAFMVAHSDVPMTGTPTERRSLKEILRRCDKDNGTAEYRFDDQLSLVNELQGQADPRIVEETVGCVNAQAISTRAEGLRSLLRGARSMKEPHAKTLGESFFRNALGILHGLVKADIKSLERVNSNLRMLSPDQDEVQAEACRLKHARLW
ncbi:hypothetical protein Neosp_010889 [[Neocosmospora] mangrovei]